MKINRYYSQFDDDMEETQIIDRLTDRVVASWDCSDRVKAEDVMASRGMFWKEEIPAAQCMTPVTAQECSDYERAKVAAQERKVAAQEAWDRGTALLGTDDLLSFLKIENFNFDLYQNHEQSLIKPALKEKGFTQISFIMGEAESFGPLSRVVLAMKNNELYTFCYG